MRMKVAIPANVQGFILAAGSGFGGAFALYGDGSFWWEYNIFQGIVCLILV
jgi:hypothetical protein